MPPVPKTALIRLRTGPVPQPYFINVDSQGLESPLDLLGSNELLDDQALPPLFLFRDKSNLDTSLDSTSQQVFTQQF